MAFILTLTYVAITLVSPGVFSAGMASWHIEEILGVSLILLLAFSVGQSKILTVPETYLGVGLLFATCFSVLITGWMGGTLNAFLEFVPVLVTFYFVALTCNSLRRIQILIWVLFAVAVFILLNGLLALHAGNLLNPYVLDEYANVAGMEPLLRLRGLGVLNDPNDLAQFLVTLTPLMWLRWRKGRPVRNFLLTIVPSLVLVTGVYFTHSRGGTLALIAVVLYGFKDKLTWVGSTLLAVLSLGGVLVLNMTGGRGISQDDGDRIGFWAMGLEQFKTHPVFGIGYGNFRDIANGRTAHNSFVLCMVELGFFGYFFWMGMIVSSWMGLSGIIRSNAAELKRALAQMPERMTLGKGMKPALTPMRGMAVAPAGMAARAVLRQQPAYATYVEPSSNADSAGAPGYLLGQQEEPMNQDQLAHTARIVRIAMVGLLVAAMFLSRTYAAILYIMLGIAVALIKMWPRRISPRKEALAIWTLAIMVSSLLLIYLFVRLRGGR